MGGQTSYNFLPDVGFAGQVADSGPKYLRSMRNAEVVDLPFGLMMAKSSADDKSVVMPVAATDLLVGISVNQFARVPTDLTAPTGGFKAGAVENIAGKGRIWVLPEEAVDPTKPVFVRIANGVADPTKTQKGSLRASSDSGTAFRAKGARWLSTAAANAPAEVEFDDAAQAASHAAIQFEQANASISATTTYKAFKSGTDRFLHIKQVRYENPTGLATDDTNYFVITLQQGATVIATWSTKTTGGNGAITADTFMDLTLSGNAPDLVVPPDTVLTMVCTKFGTQTLPVGTLHVLANVIG